MRVGWRTSTAPAGPFAVVPRVVAYQPSNAGARPTRVLLIFSPAGMDRFFEDAAEGRIPLQAAPTDSVILEKLTAFTAKHGFEFAAFASGTWGSRVRQSFTPKVRS